MATARGERGVVCRGTATIGDNPWLIVGEATAPQHEDTQPHASEPPPVKPHDQAMEMLHAMRMMLDELPLEWQIGMVKALTAWVLVKGHECTRSAQTAISA